MEVSVWSVSLLVLMLCVTSQGQGTPSHPNPNIIRVQAQNQDHILEHLDGIIDKPESEMTPQELQQHYFKMHDYDKNNMLDGNELIQAITHYHDEDEEGPGRPAMKEEEIMSLLDPIFQNEDYNKDGYIDYPEYARGQKA